MVKGTIIRRVVKGGARIGANARAAARVNKGKTKATVQVVRQKITKKVKTINPRAIKKKQVQAKLQTRIDPEETTEIVGATHFAPKRMVKKAHGQWVDVDPVTGKQTITLAKVGVPAATGVGATGIIGTAYAAEPEKTSPANPMSGVMAVGQDFYTGVTNVGSDYASIVTGGESKMSMNRLFEAGIDQIGMYGWDRPAFEEHSQAGTLPFDKALGKAAEKPIATHAGEIVTEAGIWAGTLGLGRAVWGVGRGVKLAKIASKKRLPIAFDGRGIPGKMGALSRAKEKTWQAGWTEFPISAKGGAKKGLQEAWASTKIDPFGVQTIGREGIKGHMVGKTKYSLPKTRSAKDLRKVQLKRYEENMMLTGGPLARSLEKVKRDKYGKIVKGVKGKDKNKKSINEYYGEAWNDWLVKDKYP